MKKIKKSSKKVERVSSNIQNLDSLIEGGFIKNSTNIIVGSAGSGKSILASQFLLGGLKKGEKCLYVTFEEKKDEFYKNMLEFNWDLESYEKRGLFFFLEYTPIKVKTMLEEGGGLIESIVLKHKISRIVFDSLSSFIMLFREELAKKEAYLSLFSMLRNWNCTTILTFEEEPKKIPNIYTEAMEFESDSLIAIYYLRSKSKRSRSIEILKMRGTNHSNRVYPIEIKQSGIIIDKKPSNL